MELIQIKKIASEISDSFGFQPEQRQELEEYVEFSESKWIKEGKTEEEIRDMIKCGAEYILRK